MELRLEIKLASVEELATVARALSGLTVGDVNEAKVNVAQVFEEFEAADDEMEEVESPYKAHPSEVKETPAPKAPAKSKAQTAAEKKAEKKAQEEADKANRIAQLKAGMEAQKNIGTQALDNRAQVNNVQPEEPTEAIVAEITALGDKLMAFQGMAIEAKQQLTAQIMQKVGVPQGKRPSQCEQPVLGNFRNEYRAAVNSIVNPVMGGLV